MNEKGKNGETQNTGSVVLTAHTQIIMHQISKLED